MNYQFPQHGSFALSRDDKVIVAHLSGTWNVETALAYESALMELAAPLTQEPWGHLVYLDKWDLCAPEMIPTITRLVAWCIEHKLERAANVYELSVFKTLFMNKMVTEQEGKFQRKAFADAPAAMAWLAESGFIVSSDIPAL